VKREKGIHEGIAPSLGKRKGGKGKKKERETVEQLRSKGGKNGAVRGKGGETKPDLMDPEKKELP